MLPPFDEPPQSGVAPPLVVDLSLRPEPVIATAAEESAPSLVFAGTTSATRTFILSTPGPRTVFNVTPQRINLRQNSMAGREARLASGSAYSVLVVGTACYAGQLAPGSPFPYSPLDLGNKLRFWMTAKEGIQSSPGMPASAGDRVYRALDLSGQDNHATRHDDPSRPTLQLRDALPALAFDGTQVLVLPNPDTIAEYYAVIRSPAPTWGSYGGVLDANAGNESQRMAPFNLATTGYLFALAVRKNGRALTSPFSLAPITTRMQVSVGVINPTLPRSGFVIASLDNPTAYRTAMEVHEIVAVSSELTASERDALEAYLREEWGTPLDA